MSVTAERFLNSLHYKKSPVGNRHHGPESRMPCSLGNLWELHKPGSGSCTDPLTSVAAQLSECLVSLCVGASQWPPGALALFL